MKIIRDRTKGLLHLSQRGYIKKILEMFGMKKAKLTKLSLTGHVRLSKTLSPQTEVSAQKIERVSYAFSVGSIIYFMVCCRLDLAHAMSQMSRFMMQPDWEYWRVLKDIFRYLMGSVGVASSMVSKEVLMNTATCLRRLEG